MKVKTIAVIPLAVATAFSTLVAQQPREAQQGPQSFRFRTGVELINVNATVTDSTGRFVSGLNKEDFRLFEDEQLQEITHFNSERVPVSLGIVLDTSGSMDGEKMLAAREALDRFLFELLGPEDEVFLYRFDSNAELVQGWTKDRARVRSELGRLFPRGGTAMYDAVSEAIPLAQSGRHKKKALLVISDGNDTSSEVSIRDLKQQIRESEVLVYAVGIDSNAPTTQYRRAAAGRHQRAASSATPTADSHAFSDARTTSAARWQSALSESAAAATHPRLRTRRGRSRQCRRAARHDGRQRRPHRDRPLRTRSRSGDARHCRRAEQAGTTSATRRPRRKMGAGTPSVSKSPTAHIECALAVATWRRRRHKKGEGRRRSAREDRKQKYDLRRCIHTQPPWGSACSGASAGS